jgi:4-hydroxybenzoate polyprenyltransferase
LFGQCAVDGDRNFSADDVGAVAGSLMKQVVRLREYARLMRLDKPIGTLLLLWPTWWALWLAKQSFPSWHLLIVFSAGVWIMRSAGCVINDFADRKFDGHVQRTRERPLARGAVTPAEAIGLFISLLAIAFVLVLTLNRLAIGLALIGAALATVYPFVKRFFHAPQLVLGLAFAWGIPMAYAATLNTIPNDAWVLFAACFCWIVAYDTMYAMADKADDLKINIHSTAILFGAFDRLIIAILQSAILVLLWIIAQLHQLSGLFYLTWCGAAGLFIYQQYLIRGRAPERCFAAFLNNQWVGLLVWMGIALSMLKH